MQTWARVEISPGEVLARRVPPRPDAPKPERRSLAPFVAAGLGGLLVVGTRLPGSVGVRCTTMAVAFVALVAQALPFLLIGAAVGSLFQGRLGARLLHAARRRPRVAAMLAPLAGAALPLCDCGLVPLARQVRRGTRRGAVVNGFVAGAPLTNPIVIVTTILAFPGAPGMVVGRVVVGLAVAMLAAALVVPPGPHAEHGTPEEDDAPRGALQALGAELARTAPTLVIASLAAGVVKGFVPGSFFAAIDAQPLVAGVVMMALAFLLSICSSADAFVAASLPLGALPRLSFLVLGPMLDVRLAALYRREFGTKWLLSYAAVVVPSVLVLATAWTTWGHV